MKSKHLVIVVLAIALLLSIAACAGNTDNQQNSDSIENQASNTAITPAVPFEAVPGETIDAGNIHAVCPDGWFNSPVSDMFSGEAGALDADKLMFLKGTDDSWSYAPCVSISFYGKDREVMPYEEQMDFYDNAVILEPFMIGETVWEGLSYNVSDDVVEAVISIQNVGAFNVLVRLEGEGQVISFADADVQTILSSIAY